MYYVIVGSPMLVFPLLSIAIEAKTSRLPFSIELMLKWFVFWAVGVRLFTAGVSQITRPEYTVQVILGFEGSEALLLVRELGFANAAIGLVGILSLWFASWRPAAAVAGVVFFGLAGVNHVLHADRGPMQNVAMVSDLAIALLLLTALVRASRAHP
jgi:hypothetical protein